jgi:hypothetical protein
MAAGLVASLRSPRRAEIAGQREEREFLEELGGCD